MEKNKRKISWRILLAAVLCVSALVGTTAAYMTWRTGLKNYYSIGHNEVEVDEEFDPPDEMKEGDNIYEKAVRIKNTGTTDAYIRVYVAFSDDSIREISKLSYDGYTWYSVDDYLDNLPDGWVYISEDADEDLGGYFYYTEAVAPGESTDYLFQWVNTIFESADDVTAYQIIVYAESVQTYDNNGEEFTGNNAYADAWTEFLEAKTTDSGSNSKSKAAAVGATARTSTSTPSNAAISTPSDAG